MAIEAILAGVLLLALAAYIVTGGADFGSGVWELFAKSDEEHHALKDAIAPIWEANHVWLILIVVLLFVCFPTAFAAISTALHIPLVLMLIGIVLRGAAFAFRSNAAGDEIVEHASVRVFAVTSIATPVFLGVCGGTVAAGSLRMVDGRVQTNFFEWLAPFPFAVGGFLLAICAWLAAVYMTVETIDNPSLVELFKRRALRSTGAVVVFALATAALATTTASPLAAWFSTAGAATVFALAAASLVATVLALRRDRFRIARLTAPAVAIFVIAGWGIGQYPHLVPPDLGFDSIAPESVTIPVLIALGGGSLVLLPAFVWLYRIFKTTTDA